MTTIIGIDPGASGGIAWNKEGVGVVAIPMPESEAEVARTLAGILSAGGAIHAFVEQVTGYVKPMKDEEERENRQPAHTMFKFGRGVGVLMGALLAMGVEPVEIHPRVWQKPFGIQRGTREDRKRQLKNAAQRRHPGLKVTLKIADALLIRAFGELMLGEQLPCVDPRNGEKRVCGHPGAFTEGHSASFKALKQAWFPLPGN